MSFTNVNPIYNLIGRIKDKEIVSCKKDSEDKNIKKIYNVFILKPSNHRNSSGSIDISLKYKLKSF